MLCFASCVACSCILWFINVHGYGIFWIMQVNFCKFWYCGMHNWFMFCKFVVGIRHLFIKIIYTSRTGQMIVLYNNIISIIQIKNQITIYAFYLYIPGTYKKYLCYIICIFGQCAIYPPVTFYPSAMGYFTFWFDPLTAYSWVCVPLTRQPQNPTPRILSSKTPHPYHTHHPKIVRNPHTIHKTTSITTSTHTQNIPQRI